MTNQELMDIAEATAVNVAQDKSAPDEQRLVAANFLVNLVQIRSLEDE